VAFCSLPSIASQSRQQLEQGQKVFGRYCASCHGADGAGNPTRQSALKDPLPDLRRIQMRSGKFSSEEIRRKIIGKEMVPGHRKGEMPVWGMVLSSSEVNSVVAWLKTIQRPFDPTPAD
jgi:mono/diheme cytochrome c family protein